MCSIKCCILFLYPSLPTTQTQEATSGSCRINDRYSFSESKEGADESNMQQGGLRDSGSLTGDSSMWLGGLPQEIWQHILFFAGIGATATMLLVCKAMNQLGADEFLWKQFAIRLQAQKQRVPIRTDLKEVTFPFSVTPSWVNFCKILSISIAVAFRS